jgi:serine/threonine protein kinase
MLNQDPKIRYSATDALSHAWFKEDNLVLSTLLTHNKQVVSKLDNSLYSFKNRQLSFNRESLFQTLNSPQSNAVITKIKKGLQKK